MIKIRPARADDVAALIELMRGEPLRPFDRKWQNFVVAEDTRGLVGAVQIRVHRDGSREIGSLVVAPDYRGRGLASRLMESRLADASDAVFAITGAKYGAHYAQWGFREIPLLQAPIWIAINLLLGQAAGWLFARFEKRQAKRLAVLVRMPPETVTTGQITQTAAPSHICAE